MSDVQFAFTPQSFVRGLCIITLFVFVFRVAVSNTYWVVCLFCLYLSMLPVCLDCQFLVAASIFSGVCLHNTIFVFLFTRCYLNNTDSISLNSNCFVLSPVRSERSFNCFLFFFYFFYACHFACFKLWVFQSFFPYMLFFIYLFGFFILIFIRY